MIGELACLRDLTCIPLDGILECLIWFVITGLPSHFVGNLNNAYRMLLIVVYFAGGFEI